MVRVVSPDSASESNATRTERIIRHRAVFCCLPALVVAVQFIRELNAAHLPSIIRCPILWYHRAAVCRHRGPYEMQKQAITQGMICLLHARSKDWNDKGSCL